MRRKAMQALAEVEDALIEEGVPEDEAARLVDGFEIAVQECLDEFSNEESEDAGDQATDDDDETDDSSDDDVSESDECTNGKDGYRVR